MASTLLDEEWGVLANLLPTGWQELAKETGAIRRDRGITDPEVLLKLLLLHVSAGLSLKQAVARARSQGLATISEVALFKRLKRSEAWLRELARRMFEASRFAQALPRPPGGRRLRAVDATAVAEPGATGTDWKVHFSVRLPEMACDFYAVTDHTGGETYKRIPVAAGDILLADRGYGHREGVAHVVRAAGDVIVRLNTTNFPLLTEAGQVFALLPHLRRLRRARPGEWAVQFDAQGRRFPGRLCAIRKSRAAAELAQRKIKREAAKKKTTLRPETLEAAEYIFVLTTVAAEQLSTRDVLELYRARWQVELCFKRLKSLLQLGHLPKKTDVSARAWIEGKLLTALLIEHLVTEARFFSPWGFDLPPTQPLARVHRGS
jgi:hypothetical protein